MKTITQSRLTRILISLGLSPGKKAIAAAARRAIVKSLALECSDEEIAVIANTSPYRVQKDRIALKLTKYGNKDYKRPTANRTKKKGDRWEWTSEQKKAINRWRREPGALCDMILI